MSAAKPTPEEAIRAAIAYLNVAWTATVREDAADYHRRPGTAAQGLGWPWFRENTSPPIETKNGPVPWMPYSVNWHPSNSSAENLATAQALITLALGTLVDTEETG